MTHELSCLGPVDHPRADICGYIEPIRWSTRTGSGSISGYGPVPESGSLLWVFRTKVSIFQVGDGGTVWGEELSGQRVVFTWPSDRKGPTWLVVCPDFLSAGERSENVMHRDAFYLHPAGTGPAQHLTLRHPPPLWTREGAAAKHCFRLSKAFWAVGFHWRPWERWDLLEGRKLYRSPGKPIAKLANPQTCGVAFFQAFNCFKFNWVWF